MKLGRKRYLTTGAMVEDVLFQTFKTIVLALLVVVTLYPFWNTIVVSLNLASDTIRGGLWFWPRQWTLNNYRVVWITSNIPQALFVSVSRTVLSTVTNLLLTSMLAFSLSRRDFVLRRPLTIIVVLTLYVNAGLFPSYFLIRGLGLNGTFWVYVLPTMVSAFNFIVIRTYMRSIPESLVESARIDGAREFLVLARIILPLSKPVLATVALLVSVGSWNAWFDTLLYNSAKPEHFTLQYRLMALLQSSMSQSRTTADVGASGVASNITMSMVTPVSIRSAVTIVAAVPILIVYPFLQRYFVAGLNIGSVKE